MSLDGFLEKKEESKINDNKCKYCGKWVINEACCITCYLTDAKAQGENLKGWAPK